MHDVGEKSGASLSAEAMVRFAAHLRAMPADQMESPHALSERFGIPIEVVREALAFAGSMPKRTESDTKPKAVSAILDRAAALLRGTSLWVRDHPVWSSVFVVLCARIVLTLGGGDLQDPGSSRVLWIPVAGLVGLLGLSFVNYLRAQVRYAIVTAFAGSGTWVVTGASASLLTGKGPGATDLVLGALAGILLTVLVGGFTTVAALLGAYYQMVKVDRQDAALCRQQLLERVFDLQTRLGSDAPRDYKPSPLRTRVLALRGRWLWCAIGVGAALGLFSGLATLGDLAPERGSPAQMAGIVPIAVGVGLILLTFVSYPLLGFIAGTVARAALASTLVFVISSAAYCLPLGSQAWTAMIHEYQSQPGLSAGMFGLFLVLGVLGSVGARIEERNAHRIRLQMQDHAAILGEIIRLQQRLKKDFANVCILVVDCVGSTAMKQGADDLSVEYSFRSFQNLVAKVVTKNSGTIHHAAGDGAVAHFTSAESALLAAREIQTELSEFNRIENRLASPFRCRIGLHSGLVYGNVDDVVFTQVIDIAAHIEKSAPAGGIVATEAVVDQLPSEQFAQLAGEIDGQKVFIALHPTL